MKRLLVIAVAVSLCASVAVAGDYYPIKDSGSAGHSAENLSNQGAKSPDRAMKWRQHCLLMDFDWAAIEADLLANPGYHAELGLVPVTDNLEYFFCSLQLAGNDVDWVEGDGTNWNNFNWTAPDVNPAVTNQYSQTIAMDDPLNPGTWILDPVASTGAWPWGDLTGKRNNAGYRNANDMTFGKGGVYAWAVLDAAFLGHLIAGTTPEGEASVGLYTYDYMGFGSNESVYLSESGQATSPMVRVVPEPASMLLIGLGGIAMLLRKRR